MARDQNHRADRDMPADTPTASAHADDCGHSDADHERIWQERRDRAFADTYRYVQWEVASGQLDVGDALRVLAAGWRGRIDARLTGPQWSDYVHDGGRAIVAHIAAIASIAMGALGMTLLDVLLSTATTVRPRAGMALFLLHDDMPEGREVVEALTSTLDSFTPEDRHSLGSLAIALLSSVELSRQDLLSLLAALNAGPDASPATDATPSTSDDPALCTMAVGKAGEPRMECGLELPCPTHDQTA